MKKDQIPVCPGCSKHCPLSAPRCKYGRNYAGKIQLNPDQAPDTRKKGKLRWKALLARDGVIRQLLTTGKQIKKALRHGCITEAQLLDLLSVPEQEALLTMLARLHQAAKTKPKKNK